MILSFKAFARFPMFIHKESKELGEMIKMLNTFIDEMNANDILDILYWARKFNSSGLKGILKFFNTNRMIDRINRGVENKEFNVRLLINLYCNIIFI